MESRPVVLGLGMAAAEAAERARLSKGGFSPSPLSGKSYDVERGEYNLLILVHTPLDAEIAGLVRAWLASGENERNQLRCALSLDDNYTFIQFAKRMAVQTLSERSMESYALGVTALAMIDDSRIDRRDASWAAGLLNHAVSRQHADLTSVLDRTAAVATPGMGRLLRGATGTTLDDWGYREWRMSNGVGLIRSGWARYEPTVDLVALVCSITSNVLSERYVVDDPEVATELPPVWFAEGRREDAVRLLDRSLGVVSSHGRLRRAFGAAGEQRLIVWFTELVSSADALELVAHVGGGETADGRFVVGVSAGRLFALLVAGSFQQGIEPFESTATLNDLGSRIQSWLGDSTPGAP